MAHNVPTETSLTVGPLSLAARVHGPASGQRVLALHGWLDNAASFDALAPLLPGKRLVALDLPGHGRSDHRPPGGRYHFTAYVEDALAVADALEWDRFSLLGHSLGGAIATFVAAACPKRIEHLALIEALGPLPDDPANTAVRLAAALAHPRSSSRSSPRTYARLEEAVSARQAAGDLSHGAARRLVERATLSVDGVVRWRSDARLRWPTPVRFTEEQVLAILRAIEAPTLLIAARDGLLWSHSDSIQRRLDAVAELRTHTLIGGHHLHLDTPDSVAALIEQFLPEATTNTTYL